jgi:hypothetical protein
MTNRLRVTAAIAALVICHPLAAAEPAKPASAASDKAAKAPEKKICHREVPTGSITPVKVCRTQGQIDANTQQAQDQIDRMNRLSQQPTQALHGG